MKVLITSGGTEVPLDPVRNITNMSRGTFGAKIARACLEKGWEVHYLGSKHCAAPVEQTIHLGNFPPKGFSNWSEYIAAEERWVHQHYGRYIRFEYKTYFEYAEMLEKTVGLKPDVVILAAAVSDYLAEPSAFKIRSDDDLHIDLRPAEKLISKVRGWHKSCYLVGFKLTVGASDMDLVSKARSTLYDNDCDLMVANDLMSLKQGSHRIALVDGELSPEWHAGDCAQALVDRIERDRREHSSRSDG